MRTRLSEPEPEPEPPEPVHFARSRSRSRRTVLLGAGAGAGAGMLPRSRSRSRSRPKMSRLRIPDVNTLSVKTFIHRFSGRGTDRFGGVRLDARLHGRPVDRDGDENKQAQPDLRRLCQHAGHPPKVRPGPGVTWGGGGGRGIHMDYDCLL